MSPFFSRRASQSSLFRDTDSISSVTVTMPRNLTFPRDLRSVKKAGHTTIPSRVPAHDASQDEVRYFLYMLLTLKELALYKNGPQWILETVLSWEGGGSVLRSKSPEELESLCPMQRGKAVLNPRKDKLVEMAPPDVRTLIGHAISTFVTRKLAKEGLTKEVKEGWEASLARPGSRFSMATTSENVGTIQMPPSIQKQPVRYAASAHNLCTSSIDPQYPWSQNTYPTLSVPGQTMPQEYYVTAPSLYRVNSHEQSHSTPTLSSASSISSMSASHGSTISASPLSTSTQQTSPPGSDTDSQIKPAYQGSCSGRNTLSSESDQASLRSTNSRDLGKQYESVSRYRRQSLALSITSSQPGTQYAHSLSPSSLGSGFQNMVGSPERPPILKYNTTGHIHQAIGVEINSNRSPQQSLGPYGLRGIIGFDQQQQSSAYNPTQNFHAREPQQDVHTHMQAHRKSLSSSGYYPSHVPHYNSQTVPQVSQLIETSSWSSNAHGGTHTQQSQEVSDIETDESPKSSSATIRRVTRKVQSCAPISSNISTKSDTNTLSAEKRSIANRIMSSFSKKEKSHMPQVDACVSTSRPVNNCKVDAYALNQAQFVMFKSQPSQARAEVVELEKERRRYIKSASASGLYDRGLMHSMVRDRSDDPSNAARPAMHLIDPRTGFRRQTLYQVLEEKECLDGKTRKGQEHPAWRDFH